MPKEKPSLNLPNIEQIDILRYYVNYHEYEKDIINAIKQNKLEENTFLPLFMSYKNAYMKVGRNFKTGNDSNILEIVKKFNALNKYNVLDLSEELKEYSVNNQNVIVASSKFLWLFNHDIIIMDNYNANLLKTERYDEYREKWQELFKTKKEDITKQINILKKSIEDPILDEEWFKMRVFDQYLWKQTKSKYNS